MNKLLDKIVLIGVGAGIGVLLARAIQQSAIGKIYDTYPIKPGGRVDLAWANRVITPRKYLGEHRTDLINYVDPDKVVRQFNLHSIEFGNWMNQEDRLNFLVATAASLADMASIFGVAHNRIGFKKDLSITLGARGKGGRAAGFFVPSYMVINLTKPHGHSEVLGHEYGHAIDYVLAGKKGYASGGRSTRKELDRRALSMPKDSTAYLMEMVFKILYYDDKGNKTAFHAGLLNSTEYYQRRTEVWARTMETYLGMELEAKGRRNTFLASASSSEGKPPRALVEKAAPYIRKLIKKALK